MDMEKHVIENWRKVPKDWTPEKELAVNRQSIRDNGGGSIIIIKEFFKAAFLIGSFLIIYIIGALLF